MDTTIVSPKEAAQQAARAAVTLYRAGMRQLAEKNWQAAQELWKMA